MMYTNIFNKRLYQILQSRSDELVEYTELHRLLTDPAPSDLYQLLSECQNIWNSITESQRYTILNGDVSIEDKTPEPVLQANPNESGILSALLQEGAVRENFTPEMWDLRTAHFTKTKNGNCTGCAMSAALKQTRLDLRALLAKTDN